MKTEAAIGFVAIALVLGGVAWYGASRPRTASAPGTPAAFMVPAESPYVEHADYYDVAANYPTTTPLAGNGNETALSLMRGWVSDSIARFKEDGAYASVTPTDVQMRGFDRGRKDTLQISYLIASSEHTLSYIYTTYLDTGGAHGNTFFKTFVFDTTTGEPLSLGDLFNPRSDYLGTLSQLARSQLPGVIGTAADFTFIKDGTAPDEKNFADFFFDGADFVLLFPPYQVASYAAGPVTLRFPTSQLYSILKTQYH